MQSDWAIQMAVNFLPRSGVGLSTFDLIMVFWQVIYLALVSILILIIFLLGFRAGGPGSDIVAKVRVRVDRRRGKERIPQEKDESDQDRSDWLFWLLSVALVGLLISYFWFARIWS